jgi:outer membrane protein OmpA-like peptidoglycan-associated protein
LFSLVTGFKTEAAGTMGAEFLLMEIPATAAALAAGTAAGGGSEALTWNPAGILDQPDPSLAFTHCSSLADTAYEQLEVLYPAWLGGNWAARFFFARTYNFMELNEWGEEVGTINNYNMLLNLAHARSLGSGFEIGLGLKYFRSVLAGFNSQGGALDAGLRMQTAWQPLALGLAIQNLGLMEAFDHEADELIPLIRAGLALKFAPGIGPEIKIHADLSRPLAAEEPAMAAAGLEYKIQDIIFLRCGYRLEDELGGFSLGAGFRFSGMGLDYAYQPYGGLGDTHRFTFSYLFLKPDLSDAVAPPGEAEVPAESQSVPLESIKTLKVEPGDYESVVVFKTPKLDPKVRGWSFTIKDHQGRVIKKFTSLKKPPQNLQWDGKDKSGRMLPRKGKYQYIFTAGGRKITARYLPELRPAFKLRFKDRSPLDAEVQFSFSKRPTVREWRLNIRDRIKGNIVRSLSKTGPLPKKILWDGRDKQKRLADTSREYKYDLTVGYADESEVAIAENIQPVLARAVKAPRGYNGILILGICFNFNSAVLKTKDFYKIQMVAKLLKKYGGSATAVCEGHADEIGGIKYNEKLSRRRALMVLKFLSRQPGVGKKQLSVIGYGKSHPQNRKGTEDGRARNRRVEVRVIIPASK